MKLFCVIGIAATAAMLLKSNPEIVGNADVERSMPAAGENVDVVCACCAHRMAGPPDNSNIRGYGPRPSPGRRLEASEQIKNTLASV